MASEMPSLPERPFFSCEETGFSVVDVEELQRGIRGGPVTPWLTLRKGTGNIFEHRPRRVTERSGARVVVQCDGEVEVELDFEEGTARMWAPSGEFLYCGGIDEGNDAKGYIPAR